MCFYGFIVLAWVKNFEMKQLGFCILCPYLALCFFFFCLVFIMRFLMQELTRLGINGSQLGCGLIGATVERTWS